jgi:hypothetical protein
MAHQIDPRRTDPISLSKKEPIMQRLMFVVLLTALATSGCSLLPPQRIPIDRANYLDAVSTSWKEQLLSNLVRLRYGDTVTSLEMTSITTAYELDTNINAGSTAFWRITGLPSAAAHATTSVGGSATFMNKPTINYAPVRGDALASTMIEPLNPLRVLKSLQVGWPADYILPLTVRSINALRNPFDDCFFDLVKAFRLLQKEGVIRITVEEPVEPKVTKVPDNYTVTLKDKRGVTEKKRSVKESESKDKKKKEDSTIGYLVLNNDLAAKVPEGVEMVKALKKALLQSDCKDEPVIPRSVGAYEKFEIIDGDHEFPGESQNPFDKKIYLQTRSILQILALYSKLVDVPPEHKVKTEPNSAGSMSEEEWRAAQERRESQEIVRNKLKAKLPITLHIHYDKVCPKGAFVAIEYRDYWFYIDDDDFASKDTFSSLAGILCMSETGTPKEQTPLLTLPVQ